MSLYRLQIRHSKILLILARPLLIGYFTFYYFSFSDFKPDGCVEPYAWRRVYTFRIRQPTSLHPVGSSLVIPKSPHHPASSGMVERFHRQLKAALHASNSPERWSETQPIVLLGCRSAIKADLGYSASELLYGTHLALSRTMFTPINNSSTDLSSYVTRLRTYFAKLPPMATCPQTTPTHVPQDMDKWTHVFVRNDAVRGPLNSPYLETFKILSRAEKKFKLDMNGRTEIVSVDHLNKAHFECDTTDLNVVDTPNFNPLQSPLHTPTPSPSSPLTPDPLPQTEKLYTTKSGRTVHWPKKTVQDSLHLNAICCTFTFAVFIIYILYFPV